MQGNTPIDSVKKANVYDVMLYISLMIADGTLQSERMELEHKKKI